MTKEDQLLESIDKLHEDIRELRQEMHDGFSKLSERFLGLRKEMHKDFREVNRYIDTEK